MTTKQYRAASIAIEDAMYAAAAKVCKKRRLSGEDAFICASSAAINLAAGIVVDRMGLRDVEKANQAADAMAMRIAETIGAMIEGMVQEVKP